MVRRNFHSKLNHLNSLTMKTLEIFHVLFSDSHEHMINKNTDSTKYLVWSLAYLLYVRF